jgi:putative ABC transport system permease protein
MHDFRVALRSLLRTPGFTFAAVVTLALAVGAATAVFSVARAVLLEPLPYAAPERLVRLIGTSDQQSRYESISHPDFLDAVTQSGAFERAAAYDEWSPTLVGEGEAEVLRGAAVDSGFFDVLSVRPAMGRFFVAREDQPGQDTAVVISDSLWRRRYGARTDIVGRPIRLDRSVLTIVGVLRPDFVHPHLSDNTRPIDVWTTLGIDSSTNRAPRSGRSFTAIARLRRGVTVDQAAARVATVAKRLEQVHPDTNAGRSMTVVPLHARITGAVRQPIWMLFAAVLLLLVIACVNVANLMLARVSSRGAELAVRVALGARPRDLFGPVLRETLLLGLAGAAFGLLFAQAVILSVMRAAAEPLPRVETIAIDLPVALFAVAAGLAAALFVGAIPALGQVRGWRVLQLRGRVAGDDVSSLTSHASLVVVQVALSVVLLMAATLVGRSLWNLLSIDTGIREDGATVFGVRAPSAQYPEMADVPRFYADLERRLGELPGVTAAGITAILPFDGEFNGVSYAIDGRPAPDRNDAPSAEQRTITPGYLAAVGIPMVAGRNFTSHDGADAPPVAIVDETFARAHWPDRSPIGQRIRVWDATREIVGVVHSARIMNVSEAPAPVLYLPWAQVPRRRSATAVVRSTASAATLLPAIRAAVSSISPDAPVVDPRPMRAVVGRSLNAQKLRAVVLGVFGVAALLLAAVGVAGVLATNVTRRRREIGVRMALGATTRDVAGFVVSRGMRMVAAGLLAGAALSLLSNRVLHTMLYGVQAVDLVSMGIVTALLAVTGLVAAVWPALRAASTDPITVMRTD